MEQAVAAPELLAKIAENAVVMARNAGRAHKRTTVKLLASGVDDIDLLAKTLGVSRGYISKAKNSRSKHDHKLLTEEYPKQTTRNATDNSEAGLYVKFFHDKTSVSSGAEEFTRELSVPLHKLACALYAEYPEYLRGLIATRPEILETAKTAKNPTRFQKSLLAVSASSQKGNCINNGSNDCTSFLSQL